MEMVLQVIWKLLKLCVIAIALAVSGSADQGSKSAPVGQISKGNAPSLSPSKSSILTPQKSAALLPLTEASHYSSPLPHVESPPAPTPTPPEPPIAPSTSALPSHPSAPLPPAVQSSVSAPRSSAMPSEALAPPPPVMPAHASAPLSLQVPPSISAPQPHRLPPDTLAPRSPAILGHVSAPQSLQVPPSVPAPQPPGVPSDILAPPPTLPRHISAPLPHQVPPSILAPQPHRLPPDTLAPSSPTILGHVSAPQSLQVPPFVPAPQPRGVPSDILAPPPTFRRHTSAPPPLHLTPSVSSPQPPVVPPDISALPPPTMQGHVSASPPLQVPPSVSTPHMAAMSPVTSAPPPPAMPPDASALRPTATAHASSPPPSSHMTPPQLPPPSAPPSPVQQWNLSAVPPHASRRKELHNEAPPPGPAVSGVTPLGAPSVHRVIPGSPPLIPHQQQAPRDRRPFSGHNAPESHISAQAPSIDQRRDGIPLAAPSNGVPKQLSTHYLHKGSGPNMAPSGPKSRRHSGFIHAPLLSPSKSPNDGSQFPFNHSSAEGFSPVVSPSGQSNFTPAPTPSYESHANVGPHSPASSPISTHVHNHPSNKTSSPAPAFSDLAPSPSPKAEVPSLGGHAENPYALYAPTPAITKRHHPPSHQHPGSSVAMVPSPSPSVLEYIIPAASPVTTTPSGDSGVPFLSPKISPSGSSTRNRETPLAPPIQALPPPPPNQDCAYLTCPEPLTNTPPGSPCGCVWPMKVGLRLSVALYTFFPLVMELAKEIAAGVFMKQSQVRIMGANAASQQPEKTLVLIDLVPLGDKFDNITAFLIYQRFWHKQVAINKSLFGDYEVLYVHYPGLPPSPPIAPSDIAIIDGRPYSGQDTNGSKIHPLGVDVPRQGHKHGLNGIVISAIVFSTVVAALLCLSIAWFLIFKHKSRVVQSTLTPHALAPGGPSERAGYSVGSGPSSTPLSFGSSIAAYTGSAKTFSASEMEKATDNFNPSRILGEGGFGRVYSGVLGDETKVAVKVLKRDDHQGGREFLAEVEMLSRLHHRNLVKLIGICTDERIRCLVYELVPNGSVESHLHGIDKEAAPLDWAARIKIALGAARGLAYLHEDSSPRVIHRDFKSSNILLEHDFTPKVSDFGLARTAMDEENRHISTRVMGTFGYVAPEYAMTGHLLVKSDVYSYGVVLLELLTGRKPVDMSQPPGQENLVAWTRPLLTAREGLESIIDPYLGPDISFDSVAKVAAIASMCVQPEVSHRPFMGEVVQALKLVCNECDEAKDEESTSCSHENFSADLDPRASPISDGMPEPSQKYCADHNCASQHDVEKGLVVSDIFSASVQLGGQESGSFRRHSASGPMRRGKGWGFWQSVRRMSWGSVSERGTMYKFWPGSR
ncbi:hypothetical protein Ancab_027322 [Ancistrocladus abbreviatus]